MNNDLGHRSGHLVRARILLSVTSKFNSDTGCGDTETEEVTSDMNTAVTIKTTFSNSYKILIMALLTFRKFSKYIVM